MSITTVRDLLAAMQSEDVSEAEKNLQGMTTHPQFFQWIYFIMSNPQQEGTFPYHSDWIKTIASSFISSVFAASVNEQNWDIIFQGIIKILQESNIKQLDKRIFQKSIIKSIETGTLCTFSAYPQKTDKNGLESSINASKTSSIMTLPF